MVNFRLWLTWWFQIVQPKFSQRVWVITIQKTLRLTTPAGFSATLQWTFIPFHLFTCINLAGLTVEYDDNRFNRCLVFFTYVSSYHFMSSSSQSVKTVSRCCDQPTKALTMDTMPSNPQVPATGTRPMRREFWAMWWLKNAESSWKCFDCDVMSW